MLKQPAKNLAHTSGLFEKLYFFIYISIFLLLGLLKAGDDDAGQIFRFSGF